MPRSDKRTAGSQKLSTRQAMAVVWLGPPIIATCHWMPQHGVREQIPVALFQELVLLNPLSHSASTRFLQMYVIYVTLKSVHRCLTQIVNIQQERACREVYR